jgi:hypothetical protein
MKDAFDINLLTQVQAMCAKVSVNKDRIGLKRRASQDGRKKEHGGHLYAPAGQPELKREREGPPGDEEEERLIDITV